MVTITYPELSLLPCLETLSLECNQIATLSPAVGSMLRLQVLNVSRNCITDFPEGEEADT